MTEATNLIILGLDHGYGNIKTANTIFPANVQRCAAEPAMAENKLCWAGHWFIVGEGHKEFVPDKCLDEDYLFRPSLTCGERRVRSANASIRCR